MFGNVYVVTKTGGELQVGLGMSLLNRDSAFGGASLVKLSAREDWASVAIVLEKFVARHRCCGCG